MTEEIHMDEFFFFTYDPILKKLGRDDEGYAELEGEVKKLTKQYPLIKNLRMAELLKAVWSFDICLCPKCGQSAMKQLGRGYVHPS